MVVPNAVDQKLRTRLNGSIGTHKLWESYTKQDSLHLQDEGAMSKCPASEDTEAFVFQRGSPILTLHLDFPFVDFKLLIPEVTP